MFKKVVIILSIIYFVSAFQVSYPEVQEDEIDSLLERLQKSLDRAIDESHTKILNTKTLLNNTVEATEYTLYYTLRVERQLYIEELDRIKAAAAKKGINIDDCLAFGNSTIYFPMQAFNETLLCSEFLISTADENLHSQLNKVTTFADFVTMYKKEAEECRKSTDSKSCLAKITTGITNLNLKIWKTVDNVEESVNDYGLDVIKRLAACGTTAITNYQNKLDVVSKKISDCVEIKT